MSRSPRTLRCRAFIFTVICCLILLFTSNHLLRPSLAATNYLLTSETDILPGDISAGIGFGADAAISGETAVIGAPLGTSGINTGAAYVFVRSGSSWVQQQKLIPSDGRRYDYFGEKVAIGGDTIVVASSGALNGGRVTGAAYVFVRNGSTWTEQQKLAGSDATTTNGTGPISVAISGDTVLMGATVRENTPGGTFTGAAYMFVRSGTIWSEQQRLIASDGADQDLFGNSVAISGETAIIGATLGDANAIQNVGAAYVFTRNGTAWTQQQKLSVSDNPSTHDGFGYSVAISGDSILVGAGGKDEGASQDVGAAYIFTRSGTIWNEQRKLVASDGAPQDHFGWCVTLSGDLALIGAEDKNSRTGNAYLFGRNGTAWGQSQKLAAGNGDAGDSFGQAVALSTTAALIGAPYHAASGASYSGAVYGFTVTASSSDTTPPALNVPPTTTIEATGPDGAVVSYNVSASDDQDPQPIVECAPASGSTFPIGSNTVTCSAHDASGNSSNASFIVNVTEPPPPPPPTPANCKLPDPVPLSLPNLPGGGTRRALVMGQSKDRYGYGHLLFQPSGQVLVDNPAAKANIDIVKESGSTWVRLWAEWPTYQPADQISPYQYANIVDLENTCSPNYIETDPRTKAFIEDLDEQVIRAREKGLRVVLTTIGYPRWANYKAFLFDKELVKLFNEYNGNFVVPNDLSKDGAWGNWIKFLVKRYGLSQTTKDIGTQGRYIDFLEITNEPNLMMRPQGGMPDKVARMFKTAQTIVKSYGNTLRLAGPGTADISNKTNTSTVTNYADFTEELLISLRRIGFVADKNFAWSHHNYGDVEYDRDKVKREQLKKTDLPDVNSAAWVRWMIVAGNSKYKWEGWPNKKEPQLLITEGGARLNALVTKYQINPKDFPSEKEFRNGLQKKQAALVKRNFLRMSGQRDSRLGEGIAMVSSYLTYTDPIYDSGMFDFIGQCQKPANAPEDYCQNPPPYSSPVWECRFAEAKRLPTICTGEHGIPRLLYGVWKSLPSSP
jgi:hypothetical protein